MSIKLQAQTATFVVDPGTYFLGDPCYAVPDDRWMDLLNTCEIFDNPVGTLDGHDVLGFRTEYGDGTYFDGQGGRYSVDAGLIGLTPMDIADPRYDLSELGRIVTYLAPVECYREVGGTLHFGAYVIPTGDACDDEDGDDWMDD